MDLTTVLGFAGAPIIVAFVELAKRIFPDMSARLYPALTMLFAVVWNAGVTLYLHGDVGLAVILGFLTGLVASGAYSQVKTVAKDGNV